MSVGPDREVVELLRDDPDLLAIADAVVATQPNDVRRRIGTWRLVAVAVVVGVAVTLGIVAPWHGHGSGVVGRALAAVGHEPVLHAVIESNRPDETIVTLATGRARPIPQRLEYWYDTDSGQLRAIDTVDGRVAFDELIPKTFTEPRLDPALTAFVSRYRNALKSGRAREVGRGSFHGRNVIWLRFHYSRFGERVGIDEHTYRPIVIEWLNSDGSTAKPVWMVTAIGTGPYRPSDFKVDRPRPQVGQTSSQVSPPTTPARVVRLLGWSPLWLGKSFRGLPLQHSQFMKLVHEPPHPRRTTNAVLFSYGRGADRIQLMEAKEQEQIYWLGATGNLRPGTALLRTGKVSGSGPIKRDCQAVVHAAGVWVAVEGWNQSSVRCIDAARALVKLGR